MAEREQLIRMANQIAANFRFHDDNVARIADHLRRFWAPSMRQQLLDMAEANNPALDEGVREAARRLQA